MRPLRYTVIDLEPDEDGMFLVASLGTLERMTLDTIKRLVSEGCSFDTRPSIEPWRVTNPNHRRKASRS